MPKGYDWSARFRGLFLFGNALQQRTNPSAPAKDRAKSKTVTSAPADGHAKRGLSAGAQLPDAGRSAAALSATAQKLLSQCRKFAFLESDGSRLLVARDYRENRFIQAFVSFVAHSGQKVIVEEAPLEEILALNEARDNIQSNATLSIEGVRLAMALLQSARLARASDIHIQIRHGVAAIQFRVDGSLYDAIEMTAEQATSLINTFFHAMASVKDTAIRELEFQHGQIENPSFLPESVLNVRLARGPMAGGTFLVARMQYGNAEHVTSESSTSSPREERPRSEIRPLQVRLTVPRVPATGERELERLGYSKPQQEKLMRVMRLPQGISIISGPVGSGKTTTLFSVLKMVRALRPDLRILTIEDPPEYMIDGAIQLSVTNAQEKSRHADLFAKCIEHSLRMDPNIIMIGEVRAESTAAAVMHAALTGHRVWTTVHAFDAFSIVSRLGRLGLRIEDDLGDASILTALISQRLVKILCPACKIRLSERENAIPEILYGTLTRLAKHPEDLENVFVRGNRDCLRCHGKGREGRTVIAEVIVPSQDLLNRIREIGPARARDEYFMRYPEESVLAHGLSKVFAGMVDPLDLEEVVAVVDSGADRS